MKVNNFLDYPKYLDKLFDKLEKNNIHPIIVGGFVRDFFLGIDSKDIDIELYGVHSFELLENILQEFGSVNTVGKSFGVCKLSLKNLEIDFTLPRRDNKIASGHSGFLIETDNSLDFRTAASRRDFTMNAIGFDIKKKIFLDPYHGLDSIKYKIIKAVDLKKFEEDPLRVYRAVAFSARLSFSLDEKLFLLCQEMCRKGLLLELPKERVYDEIKKILLKSSQPSVGFLLLKSLNALEYIKPLNTLEMKDFLFVMESLDRCLIIKDKKNKLFITVCILSSTFNSEQIEMFIKNFTDEKNLASRIKVMVHTEFKKDYSDSQLLILATQVNIELFLLYAEAIHPLLPSNTFRSIKIRAKSLEILNTQQKEFLRGQDIMNLGIKPSREYKTILALAYDKQLHLLHKNREEALLWLKQYLLL